MNKLAGVAAAAAQLALLINCAGCASPGPVPIVIEHPLSVPPHSRSNADEGLKLVTYNIWGLPSWMTGARSGRYQQIARELERLDPDVILLQEAWTAEARKSAPSHGQWSIARAAKQHTFFQQNGLMTLSRFPIVGGQFYPFSRAAFPDKFVNKGVLKVTAQLADGQLLNIWNVHMQDGGAPAIRLSQVRDLIGWVRDTKDGQIADLVAGDFNCTPDSPMYRELSDAFGPSAQELSSSCPFVTWDGLSCKPGAGETLDHIFVRKSTPFQSVQVSAQVAFAAAKHEDRLSDHFGIEAVLNLSTDPSLAGAFGPTFDGLSVLNAVSEHRAYQGGN